MSLQPNRVNSPLKFKGIDVSVDKPNQSNTKESALTAVKKSPLQKGKSAENLKLRLASAVSAKLASANKEGKSISTTNRSIGYLLQRKQQLADSKLNTKDISFQRPVQKGSQEANKSDVGTENDSSQLKLSQERAKTASQRTVLNALLSSRLASGSNERPQNNLASRSTRIPIYSGQNSASGNKSEGANPAKKLPPKTAPKPVLNNTRNFANLIQGNKANTSTDLTVKAPSSVNENKTNTLNSKPNEQITNKQVTNVNSNERKQFADKQSLFEKEIQKKQQEILRNGNSRKSKVGIENPGNTNTNTKYENSRNTKNTSDSTSSFENLGKWRTRSDNLGNLKTNGEDARNLEIAIENEHLRNLKTIEKSPPKVPPKIAPKPNRLGTRKTSNNLNIPAKRDKFQESILEKLETDVGSCKIATFKAMEDFSVLRMRIHRIQSSVEELRRERERRCAA